jgi:hydrogenase maturation protease
MPGRALIVALGNRLRGDDAAGLLALEALRACCGPEVELASGEDGLLSLAERAAPELLVVLDAAGPAGPPPERGWLRLAWPADAPRLVQQQPRNTHTLELDALLGLLAALGRLPPTVLVYAIAGEHFELGAAPRPAVCAAARSAADDVRRELADRFAPKGNSFTPQGNSPAPPGRS